jgi:hypothetical protein
MIMSQDSALARANEVLQRVSAGETSTLWPLCSDSLRAMLKDSLSFAGMSARIHAQLGAVDSVLDEEVATRDSLIVVRFKCRFAGLPVPANVTVGFTPSGRISTLHVRPDTEAAKEYPSAFLNYEPKTRFTLPFHGEWLVVWGGRTLAQNYHAVSRAQRFAQDLLMVKHGRSHPEGSKALRDYYCYGQPVLAPADGIVVTAVDSLPDQAIGSRDPLRPAGDHVVIDHGNGEYSLLAHMQPHSLRVRVGAHVRRGDVLGLVGNSGNTSEPHLHVHLMNGPDMTRADGLPMPFTDYLADGNPVERGELTRLQVVRSNAGRAHEVR